MSALLENSSERVNLIAVALLLALALATCSRNPAQDTNLAAEQSDDPPPRSPSFEASPPENAETPSQYLLSVNPTVLPDGRVQIEVTSNIPGTIEVMVSLSLQGQADEDVWIGKDERVRLTNGRGVTIFATSDLPEGKYDAESSFYPTWGFQDATSRATRISMNLNASSSLALVGSGELATELQFKKNGQKWVMEYVTTGDSWLPEDWVEKFGQYEELPVDRGNPKILKAYYFLRIDTTLIVNVLKKEIITWRLGRAHN